MSQRDVTRIALIYFILVFVVPQYSLVGETFYPPSIRTGKWPMPICTMFAADATARSMHVALCIWRACYQTARGPTTH
jgi:hypothetical protein